MYRGPPSFPISPAGDLIKGKAPTSAYLGFYLCMRSWGPKNFVKQDVLLFTYCTFVNEKFLQTAHRLRWTWSPFLHVSRILSFKYKPISRPHFRKLSVPILSEYFLHKEIFLLIEIILKKKIFANRSEWWEDDSAFQRSWLPFRRPNQMQMEKR